eukprot:1971674-Alexandrium_andersonii.AAC.1
MVECCLCKVAIHGHSHNAALPHPLPGCAPLCTSLVHLSVVWATARGARACFCQETGDRPLLGESRACMLFPRNACIAFAKQSENDHIMIAHRRADRNVQHACSTLSCLLALRGQGFSVLRAAWTAQQ